MKSFSIVIRTNAIFFKYFIMKQGEIIDQKFHCVRIQLHDEGWMVGNFDNTPHQH